MKKLFSVFVLLIVFVLVGCDKGDSSEIDMSKNKQTKEMLAQHEADFYGEIVHHGVNAKEVIVKRFKITDDAAAYSFGLVDENNLKVAVSLVCDLRMNGAGFSHNIKNKDGFVPKGDLEISLMKYRPNLKDIREADENNDPLFSTANGDTDFLSELDKVKKLPENTVLAFVIDKQGEDGYYKGIAWSPLFTVKQLVKAAGNEKGTCAGIPIILEEQHVVGIDRTY